MPERNGQHPTHDDQWWLGYLAATIVTALRTQPLERSRFILERAVREFRKSPSGRELAEQLMKEETRAAGREG